MSLPNWPWRRTFNRTQTPDLDDIPDQSFIDANFVDFFGKTWLPANSQNKSFDSVLRPFWDGFQESPAQHSLHVYCVADGGRWKSTEENESWLTQHIRFAAFVAGGPNGAEEPFADGHEGSWILCIVGSQELTDGGRFLQVASWDGSVFRYYGRDDLQQRPGPSTQTAWIYQGVSTAAFGDQSYMGPFDGHVNGSLVMKELRQPWLHWKTGDFDPTSNFPQSVLEGCGKDKAPYLTGSFPLSLVENAENMMDFVTSGITKWYRTRAAMDFLDSGGKPKVTITSGLKRWVAHALLTTTINIGVSSEDESRDKHHLLPLNHVYNDELASQYNKTHIWPSISQSSFTFSDDLYVAAAVDDVQLVMIQNVETVPVGFTPINLDAYTSLGPDGKNGLEPVTAIQVESGEGPGGAFTTIQPSFEDAIGVKTLMMQTSRAPLLSDTTFNAMMMVDAWNPVYSWRRGVLLQYVPDNATLNADHKTYDLGDCFIANVQASPRVKDAMSPEAEFLGNLAPAKQAAFTHAMTGFFRAVQKRLLSQVGLADYMRLAESRRRIYRPLPLDEFALTLPWALKYDKGEFFEMKQDGTIQEMGTRGVSFFDSWRASVSSYDPKLLPAPDANARDDIVTPSECGSEDSAISRSMPFSCQESPMATQLQKAGCPMRSRLLGRPRTQMVGGGTEELP
ncbi:hypothetical protein LTR85_010431 [Meristemomyces frigidus]|nr:hypothetical protein LTR85_010431 [Meristemomyces frigidus]